LELRRIKISRNKSIADSDWSDCDVVIEAWQNETTAYYKLILDQGGKTCCR